MLKPIYEKVPDEIKVLSQWVNWKILVRDGKKTKPPYQPNNYFAKTDDPQTWNSFDAVQREADHFDGIGFVLTNDDNYIGLDFDKCRCPAFDGIDEEISGGLNLVLPEVAEHVRSLNSYTELSPSGKGIHVFLNGRLPLDGKKKGAYEVYQSGRYLTMTGHALSGFPRTIEPRQAELDAFYQAVFWAPEKENEPIDKISGVADERSYNQTASPVDEEKVKDVIIKSKNGDLFLQLMSGDWEAISYINGKKYQSQSEADLALLGILAFYTGKNVTLMKAIFKKSCLHRDKCDEKHRSDGATYLDMSIEKAIAGCENVYDANYHDDLQSRLRKFNDKYAVSMLGCRCVIIDETGEEVEFLRLGDFKQFHQNARIRVTNADGQEKTYVVVDQWLKWEDRRQYPRIEFKPGMDIAPKYNLWSGFAVTAKKGDWSLMQDHIEKNICRGNEKYYRYIYGWLSRIYKQPGGERPGVAIVLRGKLGVGKGVFARYSGKPLKKHFVHVFSAHQFAGRFNAHLKNCVLLFADEAFMSDNKEATGILKGMITEPYIMCEPKGIDPFRIDNHINLIAASNASYIVPAGEAERRFCVIDVSDTRIQDTQYFRRLCAQMDNGGVEAMFHDLLAYDISSIDLRDFPRSNALFDQQLRGMSNIQQWWLDCLKFGTLEYESFGTDSEVSWPTERRIDDVRKRFNQYLESINVKNTLSDTLFGRELRKVCPAIKRDRRRDDDDRGYFYKFPPLEDCRKQFCLSMKFEIPWDDF